MSADASAPAPTSKRNLREQADFIAGLAARCVPFGSEGFAGKSYLLLTADDAAALEQIAQSLAFLAKHEAALKKAIRGKP